MKFADLRGWFHGEHCAVVAPGPSSLDPDLQAWFSSRWVMGCNRAVTYCEPDLATCVEPFIDKVWPVMRSVPIPIVFSHLCEDRRGRRPHPRIVQLPSRNVLDWLAPGLASSRPELFCPMSPFFGVAVAAHLGFKTIGLVGVDLTPDRYHEVWRENQKWGELLDVIHPLGVEVLNLSPGSRLTVVPQGRRDQIRSKGHALATA